MIRKCILENDDVLLCYVENGNYKTFDNDIIIGSLKDIIDKNISNKLLKFKNVDIEIYKIIDKQDNLIGYNYIINGYSNFFSPNKNLMKKSEKKKVVDNLLNHTYKKEVILN